MLQMADASGQETSEQHTGRYLAANVKISVIIPVYNEAKTIEAMKKQLYPYRSRCEILL